MARVGFDSALKSIKQNLIPIVAMVIMAICLFAFTGYSVVDPHNNTDSSWQYSLSNLRHSSQTLGKDVFFTYGPLFERMVTYVTAQDRFVNYLLSSLLFLIIFCISLYALYRFIKLYELNDSRNGRLVLLLSALFLIITLSAIDSLFYMILVITFLVLRREKNYLAQLLLLAGIYLFSFYKFDLTLPALGLALLAFIDGLKPRQLISAAVKWLGSFAAFAVIYFLLTTSLSLTSFVNYIHLGIANSLAYNEFMSLPYSQYPKVVLTYSLLITLVVLVWLFRSLRNWSRYGLGQSLDWGIGGLIFIVISFFAFKHAVIRTRLAEFSSYFFFGLAFIYYCLRPTDFRPKSKIPGFGISIIGIFVLALTCHFVFYTRYAPGGGSNIQNYYRSRLDILEASTVHNRFNYSYFTHEVAIANADMAVRARSVASIKSQLDKFYPESQIIDYGNTTIYADVLKQSHSVLLMPGVQNYAANPPSLYDSRYIQFLEQHPTDLVFVEETEASVDQRIPSHELNGFFQYLIHNYRPVLKDRARRQYIFERVTDTQESCQPFSSLTFNDDTSVTLPALPQVGPNSYIKLVLISYKLSLEAKAATALIKAPVYTLKLRNNEGGVQSFRTTPSILKHGVAIDPLYLSVTDYINKTPFNLSSFILNDGFPTRSGYQAELQYCHF